MPLCSDSGPPTTTLADRCALPFDLLPPTEFDATVVEQQGVAALHILQAMSL
jgi:hypothetical protein